MVTVSADKLRRIRKIAINAGFSLVVFVVSLYFCFPYERAKEVAIATAASKDLDVEIGSAGPAFGLAVAFHDIHVRTRPTTGKPTRFTVESARVGVSPWSLLSSSKTYTISLDAFGGHVVFEQMGAAANDEALALVTIP